MQKALRIENLSKTYPNGVQALSQVSLTVEQGDFFALLGRNGAGKSTAINIISSLCRPEAGRVEIFGHDIKTDWFAARSCLGLVPQEVNFNQFEQVEHIVLNQAGYYGIPRKKAKDFAGHLLKELDLWDKSNLKSKDLSGGMKRRLMIARALIHRPKLLILDEPTAGVDIDLRRKMWQFMLQLNRDNTTIILTTHYLEEAEQLCRNIAIIDAGKIIVNTAMEKLLQELVHETLLVELSNVPNPLPVLEDYRHRWHNDSLLEVEIHRQNGINKLFNKLDLLGCQLHGVRASGGRLEELFLHLLRTNKKEEL